MCPLGVSNCSYLVSPNLSLFLLVVVCHLIFVEMIFISPLMSCSSLFVFQLISQFSVRRLFNSIVMIVVILSSFSSSAWASSYSIVPEALCCCSFGSILLFYQDHGVPLLYLVVCYEYCIFLPYYRIFCPIFLPKCCRNFPWILACFSYHSSSLCNLQGSLVSLVCQRSD